MQARNVPVVLRRAAPPAEPWADAGFWSNASLKAMCGERVIQARRRALDLQLVKPDFFWAQNLYDASFIRAPGRGSVAGRGASL